MITKLKENNNVGILNEDNFFFPFDIFIESYKVVGEKHKYQYLNLPLWILVACYIKVLVILVRYIIDQWRG